MRAEETECFLCGTKVAKKSGKITIPDRFRKVIKYLMILSGVMTIASLFFDFTPSFTKCVFATTILGLVKSSADQMSESDTN
jgi:hypothetical protein